MVEYWLLKCGSKASSIGVIWELVRKADSQAPPQTFRIRNCISASSTADSRAG